MCHCSTRPAICSVLLGASRTELSPERKLLLPPILFSGTQSGAFIGLQDRNICPYFKFEGYSVDPVRQGMKSHIPWKMTI